jgi:hypothetical protein
MRRFALCAFAVLAVGLMLAPGALASTGVKHLAPLGTRHAASAGVRFAPVLSGPYSITGHVQDFAGAGISGTEVDWGWWDSNTGYVYGDSNAAPGTDTAGLFSFSGIAGGHQLNGQPSDDLHIIYNPLNKTNYQGLEQMEAYGLDFSANNNASSYSYDMKPAQVAVTITNAPGSLAEMKAGNATVGYAQADVPLVLGTGNASILPMTDFDDLIAIGYNSLGASTAQAEWATTTPVSVAGGATAPAISLDWNNALHASLAGPLCQHSGKPGTTVKMVLSNWPATYRPEFVAWYSTIPSHDYGLNAPVSTGAPLTVPLKLAANAPIDVAEIGTYRVDFLDSLVGMWDYYQVCTFKASASTIRHGKAVRLSGVVPAAAGRVTVYSTTHKVTAQPKTLTPKGWIKMKTTYKVSSRKFATGLLHPTRTTWYVVKYNGYAFPAYTSVIKVTVR